METVVFRPTAIEEADEGEEGRRPRRVGRGSLDYRETKLFNPHSREKAEVRRRHLDAIEVRAAAGPTKKALLHEM